MSPPHSEPSLDQQYSLVPENNYEHYYDSYPPLLPAHPGPVSDFYTSGNLYMYQDIDGIYHWADASATRSDSSIDYSSPLYHSSAFTSGAFPPSTYCAYQHGDFAEPPPPTTIHDGSYILHLTQPLSNGPNRSHVQDHRSSIARASDNFLAQASSSLFNDGHSSLRRGSALDYRSSIPHQTSPLRGSRPPSRKRSRELLDDGNYHVKEKDESAHPSLPATNEPYRLPQPRIQGIHPSPVRNPLHGDAPNSLNAEPHAREHETRLRPEERCMIPVPKHTSNKRVHRASEELVRQESNVLSMPTTWSIPDDQIMKGSKKPGEQKKQALACLFCRERKIACGRPPAHNPDQTCNQCARRRIKCEYPTESRRGQHKRRRKPVEGDPASQTTVRSNSSSSVTSSTTPASTTILMTATPSA